MPKFTPFICNDNGKDGGWVQCKQRSRNRGANACWGSSWGTEIVWLLDNKSAGTQENCVRKLCDWTRTDIFSSLYFVVLRRTVESKVGGRIKCSGQMAPRSATCGHPNRKRPYIGGSPRQPLPIDTHSAAAASKTFASSVNSWPSLSEKCLCGWPKSWRGWQRELDQWIRLQMNEDHADK